MYLQAYMGQLVAVQHKRGAQGGLVFARALNLDLNLGDTGEDRPEVGSFKHDYKYFSLHRKYFSLQVTNVLPELNLPPRSTALIPPGQVRATLLQLYDVGSPGGRMTAGERQDTFRTLQKILAEELGAAKAGGGGCPMLEATLSSLASLLAAPDLGPALLAALAQKIPFSVGLLRLLTAGLKQDKFKGSPQVSGNYIFTSNIFLGLNIFVPSSNIFSQQILSSWPPWSRSPRAWCSSWVSRVPRVP